MKFVLKPSLQHMTLVKMAVLLWNQNDIRALIAKHDFSDPIRRGKKRKKIEKRLQWPTIEERVVKKVQQLSLPQLLKKKVIGFVRPIGLQISEWMVFHCIRFPICVNLPGELCWTPHGTIDRKKTAEVLVRDENLDVSTRYKLACTYCLEDDIHEFWKKLPEDLKEFHWDKFPIIRFWLHYMKRRGESNAHISCKDQFEQCAIQGNKVAAEFFLQKLTPLERKESLVKSAKNVADDDTFCFLISEMNDEQRMAVFKNKPFRVLKCFKQWPFQGFFIGIANCMWDFLSKDDFFSVLLNIALSVSCGYKDCDYQKLFREFWQESPLALKSLITNEIYDSCLLPILFDIKDTENIKLLLKDTPLAVKDKLIYSTRINIFCERSILDNKWDRLEFFIQECWPSKNQMLKFKAEFENRVMCSYFKELFATKKHRWDQLFHLSGDSIFKNDKNNVEGESSSSKRFRSLQ